MWNSCRDRASASEGKWNDAAKALAVDSLHDQLVVLRNHPSVLTFWYGSGKTCASRIQGPCDYGARAYGLPAMTADGRATTHGSNTARGALTLPSRT